MASDSGLTVFVAMSGGVDSSVAAALLLERGYDVIGATMRLWREGDDYGGQKSAQDTPAVLQASRVAAYLGIPHLVIDLRQEFRQGVVAYLISEYMCGRTPNPCLLCNRQIKFGSLLQEARRRGSDALATGHYVRTGNDGRRWRLLRGRDRRKDQSYVLYMLGQAELSQAIFPLGDHTKESVRRMAFERQLPTAGQEESQDICFIPDNDYRGFLHRLAPDKICPGPILDSAGHEIGKHSGLAFYTIGQRKGLGIAAPEPLYVLALDAARNAVIVGPESLLGKTRALVEHTTYVSGEVPPRPFQATAKIRYQAVEAEVQVFPHSAGQARVHFAHSQRDISPGQGIVFYDGEEVIGGGILAEAD